MRSEEKQEELFPRPQKFSVKKYINEHYKNKDLKPTVEKQSSRIDLEGWCCGRRIKVGQRCPWCGDKME